MQIVLCVADAKASAVADDILVTYSLGSCVGVALYDPVARIGGMLHYQLPSSAMNPQRAREQPAMFADTGAEWLLRAMEALGGQRRRMKVKLAGAASIVDDGGLFNIGKRNYAAIRKVLWQNGMFVDAEEVGGECPRTISLAVADGTVTVKSNQQSRLL